MEEMREDLTLNTEGVTDIQVTNLDPATCSGTDNGMVKIIVGAAAAVTAVVVGLKVRKKRKAKKAAEKADQETSTENTSDFCEVDDKDTFKDGE